MSGDELTLERVESIFDRTTSIAIVGASANPDRASNQVMAYLASFGNRFDLYPVNPVEQEIDGLACYRSLADLPVVPDMVDVFRRSEFCPAIAAEATDVGARILWLQLGVISAEAETVATAAGLEVVMDKCTKIEHARLMS